jgi:hypothetical protein
MDCTEVDAHLPLFVGGDLEAPLDALVAAHVAACGGCAGRLESLRASRSALLALTELERRPSDFDLWPAVRGRLLAEGLCGGAPEAPAPGPRARRFAIRRFWARALAGAAAAAVLAIAFGEAWKARPAAGGVPVPLHVAVPRNPAAFGAGSGTEGLVVPATTGALAGTAALEPAFAAGSVPDGRLRRAGPQDELLRDMARPFPYGLRLIRSVPVRGQGTWSLASDGGELR